MNWKESSVETRLCSILTVCVSNIYMLCYSDVLVYLIFHVWLGILTNEWKRMSEQKMSFSIQVNEFNCYLFAERIWFQFELIPFQLFLFFITIIIHALIEIGYSHSLY